MSVAGSTSLLNGLHHTPWSVQGRGQILTASAYPASFAASRRALSAHVASVGILATRLGTVPAANPAAEPRQARIEAATNASNANGIAGHGRIGLSDVRLMADKDKCGSALSPAACGILWDGYPVEAPAARRAPAYRRARHAGVA